VRRGSGLRSGLDDGKASHQGYEYEKFPHKTSKMKTEGTWRPLRHSILAGFPAAIRTSCIQSPTNLHLVAFQLTPSTSGCGVLRPPRRLEQSFELFSVTILTGCNVHVFPLDVPTLAGRERVELRPIQPKPRAETSSPLCPNLRLSIISPFPLSATRPASSLQ
jgi:hypothetical protein